ncbi:hypothetical protein TNCV_3181151 [Trichonephila clavipes]|nr:hypothetical protein TNCV_3181151 [Trichonephila clavipes]
MVQKISRKESVTRPSDPTCSIMVWAGIMIDGRTGRAHIWLSGRMGSPAHDGQRYIDSSTSPHVRPFPWCCRQVAGRNYPPTNKNTLIRALTDEWDKLPQQLLDNVVQKVWYDVWNVASHFTVDMSRTDTFLRCPLTFRCIVPFLRNFLVIK